MAAGDEAGEVRSLRALRDAEARCTRCSLYRNATQVVPGGGSAAARLMLVGEQPGDKEDLTGEPFVGPAGQVLDRALALADIPRQDIFVTNAVKHFKNEPRGKRRLHKRPNADEIDRCNLWLRPEIRLVGPAVIVALGATAVRAIFGRPASIAAMRGRPHPLAHATTAFATIHPSYLLRIREARDREAAYDAFVNDLRLVRAAASLS